MVKQKAIEYFLSSTSNFIMNLSKEIQHSICNQDKLTIVNYIFNKMGRINVIFMKQFMNLCKSLSVPLPPQKSPTTLKQKQSFTVIGDNIYALRHQPGVSETKNLAENKVVYLKKTQSLEEKIRAIKDLFYTYC